MNRIKCANAFSIVELVIVITVIGILATITLVAYPQVQNHAKDQKIKEGASKISGAIEEWAIRTDAQVDQIEWGVASYGPVQTYSNGVAYCTGDFSQNTYSWVSSGKHTCTLEDILVESNYLPSGYIKELPQNSITKQPDETYRIVNCINQARKFVLLYSLQAPTTEDDAEYDSIITMCGIRSDEKSNLGMRGAKLILIEDR